MSAAEDEESEASGYTFLLDEWNLPHRKQKETLSFLTDYLRGGAPLCLTRAKRQHQEMKTEQEAARLPLSPWKQKLWALEVLSLLVLCENSCAVLHAACELQGRVETRHAGSETSWSPLDPLISSFTHQHSFEHVHGDEFITVNPSAWALWVNTAC